MPDVRDIQDMFRYIRKWEKLDDFRYFAISEFGSSDSKSHRPHWHFFFFYPKKYVNRTLLVRSPVPIVKIYAIVSGRCF